MQRQQRLGSVESGSSALDLHLRHNGLRKGRKCDHCRLLQWSFWFAGLILTIPTKIHLTIAAIH